MTPKEKTRREALQTIVASVAAAAGLSTLEIDALLAQVKKTADLTKLAGIKPTDESVKALKVLLVPKTQATQVFESEFGRAPALKPTHDAQTKRSVCPAYLGSGACTGLDCGLVVCNGLTCSPLGQMDLGERQHLAKTPARAPAAPVAQQAQAGADLGAIALCFCGCWGGRVGPIGPGGRSDIAQSQWLRTKQTDPYIRALMRELEVSTPEALEKELVQILAQRRAGM